MLPSCASRAAAGKHIVSRIKDGPKTNAHDMQIKYCAEHFLSLWRVLDSLHSQTSSAGPWCQEAFSMQPAASVGWSRATDPMFVAPLAHQALCAAFHNLLQLESPAGRC